jgi:hypothetical protein
MPDPIIDPTTIAVALKRPRLATKPVFPSGFPEEGTEVADGELTCPTVLLERLGRCLKSIVSAWFVGRRFLAPCGGLGDRANGGEEPLSCSYLYNNEIFTTIIVVVLRWPRTKHTFRP